MVFVAMGQEDATDLIFSFNDRRNVRDDQVDAEHVGFRKHQATVDDQQTACGLYDHHVEADFAQASQRQDTNRVRVQWACCFRIDRDTHGDSKVSDKSAGWQ